MLCALSSNAFGEKSFLAWNYNSLQILTHVEKTGEPIINLKVFRRGSLFFLETAKSHCERFYSVFKMFMKR